MITNIKEVHEKYEAIGYVNGNVVLLCRCCGHQFESNIKQSFWLIAETDLRFNLEAARKAP